jgi:hypothetical protein
MLKIRTYILLYIVLIINTSAIDVFAKLSDSLKQEEYSKPLNPVFEQLHWEKQTKNLHFEEDTIANNKKKNQPKETEKKRDLRALKYVFIGISMALILFVIYKLIKNRGGKNLKLAEQKFYASTKLNEQEIKNLDFDKLLNDALNQADYKTAFRVQYLRCIKHLILKKYIVYRKNATNYEILHQLKGKNVYYNFKILTLQFDYIWYGKTEISNSSYNQYLRIFNEFNKDLEAS